MKVYFTGLNGLRFFAAAIVWFTHVSATVRKQDYTSIPQGMLNPDTGKLGVLLFFVLSGFLITYLLLAEKNKLKP